VISNWWGDKSERLIAYASEACTETQKRHSQIQKETLSIIFQLAGLNGKTNQVSTVQDFEMERMKELAQTAVYRSRMNPSSTPLARSSRTKRKNDLTTHG